MNYTIMANCIIAGLCTSKLWGHGEQGYAVALFVSAICVAIFDIARGSVHR